MEVNDFLYALIILVAGITLFSASRHALSLLFLLNKATMLLRISGFMDVHDAAAGFFGESRAGY
jgi:hypothetical protein